jgi:hypothetical protein
MKPYQPRPRPALQSDLFDSALAPATTKSLEIHHDELVELLSRMLWQVVHDADATQRLESSDEQDQP